MLGSMYGSEPPPDAVRAALVGSPTAERTALLAALDGRFIKPGKGNMYALEFTDSNPETYAYAETDAAVLDDNAKWYEATADKKDKQVADMRKKLQ